MFVQSLPFLLKGALTTIEIALISMAIGFCGGLILGVLNCKKIRNNFFGSVINGFVWMIRGTPLFVQILIAYYALPEILGFSLTPFTAGVITLGVNSTAYISVITRAGIDAINDGQWDAAYAVGLTPWLTLKGIILPQMLKITLPGMTNELTSLIKETSILMVIGVAELTKVSKDIVARELDPMSIYLATALIYLCLTSGISLLAHTLEKRWHL